LRQAQLYTLHTMNSETCFYFVTDGIPVSYFLCRYRRHKNLFRLESEPAALQILITGDVL
jgi:hypothetical protein